MADQSSSGGTSSRGYTADSSRNARCASIPEDAALPCQQLQKPAPRPSTAASPAQNMPLVDKLEHPVGEPTDAEAADGFAKWAAPLQYFRMPHVRYASEIGTGDESCNSTCARLNSVLVHSGLRRIRWPAWRDILPGTSDRRITINSSVSSGQ